MLVSLTIKQFALIEHVHLELDGGMTVFTGETGAGKSMLIDALGAAFGARASSDWVRHGAERAEVTAMWLHQRQSATDMQVVALLQSQDIEIEDELVLRRVINRDGRSRAYINGVAVTTKLMQQLGQICLDLHGQHEHQALLQPEFQRSLLDARVQPRLLADVRAAYDVWYQASDALHLLQRRLGESEQQIDWMRNETARLQALELEGGLAERLHAEVQAGRHHAQIRAAAAAALNMLDDGEPSARELIALAAHELESVREYHAAVNSSCELLEQIDALIGEAVPELADVLDCSFDEQQLELAEQRLMQLTDAMRRHHCDEEGLLALIDSWQQRLSSLDTADWDEAEATAALAAARTAYMTAAETLGKARRKAADELCLMLRPFLDRLALAGMQVRFRIDHGGDDEPFTLSGMDHVRMQVMSNPGEPWRDLAAVASGGELSRMVLALKGCGALDEAPYLAVFDEVDTGIGGETAWCVGTLLASMGRERQVLVISHLPQVAACGDRQVVISKFEQDGRTLSSLRQLEDAERRLEIARMLGGAGEDSLPHADSMLARGAGGAVRS